MSPFYARKLVERIAGNPGAASEAYGFPKEKFMIHLLEFSKENIATAGSLHVDK
jgi:hypothetical protein